MEIIEKKVELIELFYDLIFVYAISRLTSLINNPINGGISLNTFFYYIISFFCDFISMALFYKLC
ncbi:hypothetical protein [Methanobrevibacter oralis]|uniref:Bacterial low temperature requirement A protein LtrA n=1 Tax=Methanobrevibacter oralis TaxID=66851 RepID=A0A162FNA5_METOA|nr:hypothetical protein [Methanobrevibacter oralis]KZX12610.1 bacterial low temperature requirement A protein LtrA [Methanobrevibacter oralis]